MSIEKCHVSQAQPPLCLMIIIIKWLCYLAYICTEYYEISPWDDKLLIVVIEKHRVSRYVEEKKCSPQWKLSINMDSINRGLDICPFEFSWRDKPPIWRIRSRKPVPVIVYKKMADSASYWQRSGPKSPDAVSNHILCSITEIYIQTTGRTATATRAQGNCAWGLHRISHSTLFKRKVLKGVVSELCHRRTTFGSLKQCAVVLKSVLRDPQTVHNPHFLLLYFLLEAHLCFSNFVIHFHINVFHSYPLELNRWFVTVSYIYTYLYMYMYMYLQCTCIV